MFDIRNPIHWLAGVAVLVCLALLARGFFSAEERERRRRNRSHGRVISKVRRPMVSLAVKTRDEDPVKKR